MMLSLLTLSLLMSHGQVDELVPVAGYDRGREIPLLVDSIPSRNEENLFYLEQSASQAFLEMHAQAAKEGIELKVRSAFRTNTQQKQMKRRRGDLAAPAGFSNHQMGKAVDLQVERKILKENVSKKALTSVEKYCRDTGDSWTCPTAAYWWLYKNAQNFGFEQTLSHEKWHWVFDESRIHRDG